MGSARRPKLTSFDAGLAATLSFAPALLHYALMTLVSVSVVAAFDIVGSVLVVALMITPPAAAYLLTDRLKSMIFASLGIGAVIFALAILFAPQRWLVAAARRRRLQRLEFAVTMLTAHLLNHERTLQAGELRCHDKSLL